MKKHLLIFIFILVTVFNAFTTEQVHGDAMSFGFTKDGYYCKVNINFHWAYSGHEVEFYKRTKENVTGYIESRLKLIFFDKITFFSSEEIEEQMNIDKVLLESGITTEILKQVNKDMVEADSFHFMEVVDVKIEIIELFETSIVPPEDENK